MPSPRVIYAGTPEFAVPPLTALIDAGLSPLAVYTQPDRPAGRGRKTTPSPVKRTAIAAGIEVRQPPTLRDAEVLSALHALNADLIVVAAYGLLLPQPALDAARLGCINIHASLLPRWRGAAPIQRAILADDQETGICIMRMEAGLDTGPVYAAHRVPITATDTAGTLHDKLAPLGARALMAALPGILDGSATPVAQDESAATYAKKLDKAEARIDWARPAVAIGRMIRAFNPWPVAQTELDGDTIRVWSAESVAERCDAAPGVVVAASKQGIDVATADGLLRITRLQPAGRRPMPVGDFLNSRNPRGHRLG